MTTSFSKAPIARVTAAKGEKYRQDSEFVGIEDYEAGLGYVPMAGEIGMLAVKSKFTDFIKGVRVRVLVK